MKKTRGFVGPLGDDFPSIFPIVAGVLLFLGTMAYAASLVDEKNNYLEIRKAALGLSYIVTQEGSFNAMSFKQQCGTELTRFAEAHSVKFFVAVEAACKGVTFAEDPEEVFRGGEEAPERRGVCSSERIEEISAQEIQERNPVLLTYPTAVSCPEEGSFTKGLGVITVLAWR